MSYEYLIDFTKVLRGEFNFRKIFSSWNRWIFVFIFRVGEFYFYLNRYFWKNLLWSFHSESNSISYVRYHMVHIIFDVDFCTIAINDFPAKISYAGKCAECVLSTLSVFVHLTWCDARPNNNFKLFIIYGPYYMAYIIL